MSNKARLPDEVRKGRSLDVIRWNKVAINVDGSCERVMHVPDARLFYVSKVHDLIVPEVRTIERRRAQNTIDYVKLAPCTDQSRTLDIPILLHRLGLAIQVDLSLTCVSVEVEEWAVFSQPWRFDSSLVG